MIMREAAAGSRRAHISDASLIDYEIPRWSVKRSERERKRGSGEASAPARAICAQLWFANKCLGSSLRERAWPAKNSPYCAYGDEARCLCCCLQRGGHVFIYAGELRAKIHLVNGNSWWAAREALAHTYRKIVNFAGARLMLVRKFRLGSGYDTRYWSPSVCAARLFCGELMLVKNFFDREVRMLFVVQRDWKSWENIFFVINEVPSSFGFCCDDILKTIGMQALPNWSQNDV